MFEEAGCADAARDVRREQKKIAQLTQIILPQPTGSDSTAGFASSTNSHTIDGRTAGTGVLDIPTFLDTAVSWRPGFARVEANGRFFGCVDLG